MQPDRRVVWTLFVSQSHPLVLDFTFNQQSVSLSSRFAFGPVLFQVFQVFEVMVHVDNGTWCATDRPRRFSCFRLVDAPCIRTN